MKDKLQNLIIGSEGLIILGLLILSVFFIVSSATLKTQKDIAVEKKKTIEEELTMQITELSRELDQSRDEADFLNSELEFEKDRLEDLEDDFRKITNTVDDLEKLKEIDEELLQKYSKVFFLNEHYTPPSLRDIDGKYTYGDKDLEIHRSVDKFLEDLLEESEDDDLDLLVTSAFRSFGTQSSLKSQYLVSYGSGANQFSADQGYSEHQLGTTVDFTTSSTGTLTTAFELTPEFEWLENNAYKYGFVLSYPKGNVYYEYEPWHWRFVGKDLARKLHRSDEFFYDLEQREIDEYLLELFD